jgi:hypothetical protein
MTFDWTLWEPVPGCWSIRPVGEPEHAPIASLVLHVNREALHHLAEVSLLRDLYRATGGARLA